MRRYRASQKRRGMKLVRLWVPDPKAPGFRRQALLLRGALEEREALDCIEAVAALATSPDFSNPLVCFMSQSRSLW